MEMVWLLLYMLTTPTRFAFFSTLGGLGYFSQTRRFHGKRVPG